MAEIKKRIPKRRFKEFWNAGDWEESKLGDLSDSFEYGLNAAAKEFDGKNKYIRITDIDEDSRLYLNTGVSSPNIDLSSADNFKLKYGDILFARTGASVGKSYIYKVTDGLVYYAGFLIRARIKNIYNPEFVFYSTLTDGYKDFIRVTSQRSGQPGVNAQEYSTYSIKVPKEDEQSKIGNHFKTLDNLISLHQRKLDKIKSLKKAYLSEMFPAERESVPKRRFKGFSGDWERCEFSKIATRKSETSNCSKELPSVEYEDIVSGQGVLNKNICDKSKVKNGIKFSFGDVLFGKLRPYLKNWIYASFSGVAVGDFWVLQTYETDSLYLYYLIQTSSFQTVANQSTGTKMPRSDWNLVSQSIFSVPTNIDEQRKIGQTFQSIDNLITLQQQKLDKLKNLKKAYLNEMFV